MWKIRNLILLVLGTVLALALVAEETKIPMVLPADGGAITAQAEHVESIPVTPQERSPGLLQPSELSLPEHEVQRHEGTSRCLALSGGTDDLCATGMELSLMKACLVGEECEALEAWEKQLGTGPRSAVRAWPTLRWPEDKR